MRISDWSSDVCSSDLKQRAGNRSQDIAQAAAAVAERRANLANAREDYERRKALIATGAISQAVFDATRAQYDAARAQLDAAEQALSLQRAGARVEDIAAANRSEEHTSELQSLMRISSAVFCLKIKTEK